MKRRRTRLVAWWALLAVFLAQLATAAYACPQVAEALSGQPEADVTTPCANMRMADGQDVASLCIEHCKVGQQVVDNQPATPQIGTALVFTFCVRGPAVDVVSGSEQVPEHVLARATAPPVFASSNRLRI